MYGILPATNDVSSMQMLK